MTRNTELRMSVVSTTHWFPLIRLHKHTHTDMQHKQRGFVGKIWSSGDSQHVTHWRWTEPEKTIESSLTDWPADFKYAESAGPVTEHTHTHTHIYTHREREIHSCMSAIHIHRPSNTSIKERTIGKYYFTESPKLFIESSDVIYLVFFFF